MTTFTARLAPSFEDQPLDERVYEVITPEGERIASVTSPNHAVTLAEKLNELVREYADRIGPDMVIA